MKTKYSILILNALPDKKIKSLGNKGLIKINSKDYLIDYQIKFLQLIFKNPEIIIVGGFDSKRLKKYIDNNFKNYNIKYIDHKIDNKTNVGTSIRHGMKLISNTNCLIINSSLLFDINISKIILKNISSSFALVHNGKGSVGYTTKNNYLLNCYYDLPNSILDCVFINTIHLDSFKRICASPIDNLYLFEIINKCIQLDVKFKPVNIPIQALHNIDSLQNIEKVKSKICII